MMKTLGLLSLAALAFASPAGAQLNLPLRYEVADSAFGDLPEGRIWGGISAIALAPDGRSIWVADRCERMSCSTRTELPMIFHFDLEGRLLHSFGAGLVALPHGLHVDREGNVWIADAAYFGQNTIPMGHVVRKFSPTGDLLLTLGEWGVPGQDEGHFTKPSDVLVAPNGDIFVADGHDNTGSKRIAKFDRNGKFLMQWGSAGGDSAQFRDPHTLAMDSQGRLFVGDRGNHRIQIFTQDGAHLATWTQFGSPSDIFIDSNDRMYVADSDSNATTNPGWYRGIYIGSAVTGWVDEFVRDPEPNADELVTSGAEGVVVDATGAMYGAEVGQRTLIKYLRKSE